MPNSVIPHFGLYGETINNDDTEFFHIENIEHRSRRLGWKIDAHRHSRFFQLLIINTQTTTIQLDEQHITLSGNWVISIPAGAVHGFEFSPDTDGRVITLEEQLLEDTSQGKASRFMDSILEPSYIGFNKDPLDFQNLWQLVTQLEHEFLNIQQGSDVISEYLIKAILIRLQRQKLEKKEGDANAENQVLILKKVKQLIEQNYKSHWNTEQYAEMLNISSSRLSRLTKATLNQSLQSLIHQRLLLEAKRHLIYTSSTIEAISYELGFKDPGYFSRFFKRAMNMPPGQYRQKHID